MTEKSEFGSFDVRISGATLAVRDALREVLSNLQPLALSDDEVGTVELVLAEALNNIVEHAFDADEKPGEIRIRCWRRKDGLHFAIIDDGLAMPENKTPGAFAPDVNVKVTALPEGGFGWFLIHTLAKDVRYARVGETNHLNLRVAYGG